MRQHVVINKPIYLTDRQMEIIDKLRKGYKLAFCWVDRHEKWFCLINSLDEIINIRPDVGRKLIEKQIVVYSGSEKQQTNYTLNPRLK